MFFVGVFFLFFWGGVVCFFLFLGVFLKFKERQTNQNDGTPEPSQERQLPINKFFNFAPPPPLTSRGLLVAL